MRLWLSSTFYFSIMRPLMWSYVDTALTNLLSETKTSYSHQPLSRIEKRRLLQALYRFQICCNLFGAGYHHTRLQPRLEFTPVEIMRTLICNFEPWEVEEIACIYTFAKEKYEQIFNDIRLDVHENSPKFKDQRPPTPDGAFDLETMCKLNSLLTFIGGSILLLFKYS